MQNKSVFEQDDPITCKVLNVQLVCAKSISELIISKTTLIEDKMKRKLAENY